VAIRTGRGWLRTIALLGAIGAAACIDGVGPRPRPGTTDPDDGPGNTRAEFQWFETQPRVIELNATDSVTVNVSVSGTPRSVYLVMRSGQPVELRRVDDLYRGRLAVSNLMFGYRPGDLRQTVAFIEISTGESISEHRVVMNVKDETVPNINVTAVSPGIQMSDHVLNIRHDGIAPGSPVPASIIRAFYNSFPDIFHFIAVVEPVTSNKPIFYTAVRNNTDGIGLAPFDNGATYGSATTLEGLIQYPNASDLDLARTDNIHEIAHRWMNYLEHSLLSPARPHWPLSTLAHGITGWKDPVTGGRLLFPYDLTQQGNGTFAVRVTETPRQFNDMELYLMGLLSPDSVRPHVVFADQNQQSQLRDGGILHGPVDTVRIEHIIATNGVRSPAAGIAPREFRMGTIVLTRGGILTRQEMAFFEHMAVRGEQSLPLPFANGITRGTTQPFFLATGGRASLSTRIRLLQ
jgi:hypothetical protein